MINEVQCYMGSCDICEEPFTSHNDFSIFLTHSDVTQTMSNEEWYADGTDPEHQDKQYCPNCFKYHSEIDDKIIVDLSRKKEA